MGLLCCTAIHSQFRVCAMHPLPPPANPRRGEVAPWNWVICPLAQAHRDWLHYCLLHYIFFEYLQRCRFNRYLFSKRVHLSISTIIIILGCRVICYPLKLACLLNLIKTIFNQHNVSLARLGSGFPFWFQFHFCFLLRTQHFTRNKTLIKLNNFWQKKHKIQ
jgi:hypothetical protein